MKFYFYLLIVIVCLTCFSCKEKRYKEASEIIKDLSLEQKIGQLIMVGVPGSRFSNESRAILKKYLPGGIILFGFNINGKNNMINFIQDLQNSSMEHSGIPLFISIDQEGGRVKRITEGVTQFPGNIAFGIVDDYELTYNAARIIGMQLRLLGVNMNLTPVVDVNNNPDNPVINTRSFGSSPEIVSKMGKAFINGQQRSRCISVAKHFPGHGDTNKDSHLTLPVINYDMKRLESIEFVPFQEAMDTGVEAIMTAHISFPEILKSTIPATISKKFLTDLLRNKFKFDGIIISDDMEMNAIAENMTIGEAAVKSIDAGADIILISTYGKSIPEIFESLKEAVIKGKLNEDRINNSVKRIIELKLRYGIMKLQNGKIIFDKISFDKEDLQVLNDAEKVNEEVSKKAVYFYEGTSTEIKKLKSKNIERIIISSDFHLNNIIKSQSNNLKIFNNLATFTKYKNINKIKMKGENKPQDYLLFYNINNITEAHLKNILTYNEKNFSGIILLSSGNPFILSKFKKVPPVIFSFSNTEESLKQMIKCISGEFIPRRKINVNLGLKE